ncbi:hypothetical protein AB6Q56_06740 [Dechloromonas sp. ARDL1]|uniref:hypothetical protein n=1 Tax=Dechloromonas sp. ARDL1 TaxID=3322121 RepID=UPI003DA79BE0
MKYRENSLDFPVNGRKSPISHRFYDDLPVNGRLFRESIVAMAGVERDFRLHKGGGVGLHRPFIKNTSITNIPPSKIAEQQAFAMRSVRDFFVAERMPQRLIDEMMNRSSRDIYWLTIDDYIEVPQMSAWYEEMLIAQCQYNPSINERQAKAILSRNKAAIDAARNEMVVTAGCGRALIGLAQKKLQGS